MKIPILLSLCFMLTALPAASVGSVIVVKADGSGDQPDIQTAVMAASPGDSVCLVDPLYTGPGNRNIFFLGKAITVFSPSGDPDLCVIDCENVDFSQDRRGFIFSAGEDSTSVLKGVTIRDAFSLYAHDGSGIHCASSSPTITDCKVIDSYGGTPLICDSASPIISGTLVAGNFSSGTEPGGIRCMAGSSPRITDCEISNNFGGDCGEKSAGCMGGALMCEGGSSPLVIRCIITGNETLEANGSAVGCLDSSPTIIESIISYNQSSQMMSSNVNFGTGIDMYNSTLHVEGCLIFGNGPIPIQKIEFGGGISVRGGSHLYLVGSTLVGNAATSGGGGIYLSGSDLTAQNSIIAFNELEALYTDAPGTISLTCCNIYGNTGGDWTGPIAGQLGINGNMSVDPVFCDVGTDDLTLRTDSPCLALNQDPGTACGQIGARGAGCFTVAPRIIGIADVPDDQGRLVRISWHRSEHDAAGSPSPVTGYGIYRYQGDQVSSDLARDKLAGWDFIAAVHARGDEIYQFTAPTLCDSTISSGMCWTKFMVSATTAQPLVYFDSPPDSGYSVDNLQPGVPQDIQADYSHEGVDLDWDPVPVEDLQYYRVYRGEDPGFLPSAENLLHATTATRWVDPAVPPWTFHYKISAVDFSGNESEPGSPTLVSAVEDDRLPRATVLLDAVPNPFNPATTLSFELAEPCRVKLKIFDVSGRLVADVLDEPMARGVHGVVWEGRDGTGRAAAAGVYFFRLEAGSVVQTKRMLMLK